MGLGGPLGGIITDWSVIWCPWYCLSDVVCTARIRVGWRWAFLIQVPVFGLSFILTSYNLSYVTPVSLLSSLMSISYHMSAIQGKSKSTKEVLKRIDYGGSATLLVSVNKLFFPFVQILISNDRLVASSYSSAPITMKVFRYAPSAPCGLLSRLSKPFPSVVGTNSRNSVRPLGDIHGTLPTCRVFHCSRASFSPFPAQAEDPCSRRAFQLSRCSLQFLNYVLLSHVVPDCYVDECLNGW